MIASTIFVLFCLHKCQSVICTYEFQDHSKTIKIAKMKLKQEPVALSGSVTLNWVPTYYTLGWTDKLISLILMPLRSC